MSRLRSYPTDEDFDPSEDYMSEHLSWLSGMPSNFRQHEYKNSTHMEVMQLMYDQLKRNQLIPSARKQWLALCYYWNDKYVYKKAGAVSRDIDNKMLIQTVEIYWSFVTIGFNEQTLTLPKIIKVCEKVAHHRYVKHCLYAIEKHRENGVHHHAHFLITWNEKISSSICIQDFYKIAGIKEIVTNKAFIDVKSLYKKKCDCQPYAVYDQYIRGQKKEAKMKYVEMDRKWRNDNGIPQFWDIQNQED